MSTEPYTVDQAAAILGCEKETAAERIISGDLPGLKFGRDWILPRGALLQRLDEMALEEAAKRRQERQANGKARTAIKAARKPGSRARQAPALPQS